MPASTPPDRDNGLLNLPHYEQFRDRLTRQYSGTAGRLVLGDGNPQGNVAIIGFRPDGTDEKAPFTGDHSGLIRKVIKDMGVPPFHLWYSYVVKQQQPKEVLLWDVVKPWSDTLFDELSVIKCRATILCGIEAAWAVLGTDEPDLHKLRLTRFCHRRAVQTNIFVTYGWPTLSRFGLKSHVGQEFMQDLTAVFQVQDGHFTKSARI